MVLPEGFALPPLPYLVGLVIGVLGAAGLVYLLRPPVTNWTVVALVPWMATGGVLHGFFQLGLVPDVFAPLFDAPAVYATLAIVTGLAWGVAAISAEVRTSGSIDRTLGTIGTGVACTFLVFAVYHGIMTDTIAPFWPVMIVVVTGIVTALTWLLIGLVFTESASVTGVAGATVVLGHALDGVSTAIGYDVIPNVRERTPVSRAILEAGDSLPTADLMGAGWLFVCIKLALATAIVILFREYAKEEPVRARLLLALVAAIGLGPGVQNLVQFVIAG